MVNVQRMKDCGVLSFKLVIDNTSPRLRDYSRRRDIKTVRARGTNCIEIVFSRQERAVIHENSQQP